MLNRGVAIRYFPYHKYILQEDEMIGEFYAVSHTIYKLFRIHKFTKPFKTFEELNIYLKLKGYEIEK